MPPGRNAKDIARARYCIVRYHLSRPSCPRCTSQQQQHLKKVLLREKGSLSPFVWIRETRKTIRRVPPGASVTFDASLLVFKPGAFRVDNFKVHFAPSSSSKADDDENDDIEDESIEDNITRNARRLAPCAGFSLFVVG